MARGQVCAGFGFLVETISGCDSSGARAQESSLPVFDCGTCSMNISDGGTTGDGVLCSIVDGSSENLTDRLAID